MMTRVDEILTAAIVGKTYLVPTVEHQFFGKRGVFPIMGIKHEDAEFIKFPEQHYHPDWRFMPEWALLSASAFGEVQIFRWPLASRGVVFGPVIYRRRKCRRVPPTNTAFSANGGGRELHDHWFGKDAARGPHGLICPHRGTVLGSVPADADGNITCPLHGLKFCAATGKSISTRCAT